MSLKDLDVSDFLTIAILIGSALMIVLPILYRDEE